MLAKTAILTFRDRAELAAACARTARAGFEAVALSLDDVGIEADSSPSVVQSLREIVEQSGLRVAVADVGVDASRHFGSPNGAARNAARERAQWALERAEWLGAETLTLVPAIVARSPADGDQPCSYAQALNATHFELERLRFHAERRGVAVAVIAPTSSFLLSPVELRELLDAQHSPWICACLDVAACARIGSPTDWIQTLGPHLRAVRIADGEAPRRAAADTTLSAQYLRAVCAGLEDVAFSGHLCCPEQDLPDLNLGQG